MPADFRSDNVLGVSPEILEALARASAGAMPSYGRDEITARLRDHCCGLFECDVDVFPVLTGTAGNALSIATLTGNRVSDAGGQAVRDSVVYCHVEAHIIHDELGAPEFYARNARIEPVAGADGKIDPADLERAIGIASKAGSGGSCLSVAQATEAGTVYQPGELAALTAVARRHGLGVHLDGARFANAVAALGCSPADLSWRAGADLLVLGATKNGAFAAELVVIFRRELSEPFRALWHRGGHRLSKMRFLSAQLEAYLTGELWLRNASHANDAAASIARAIRTLAGVELVRPVDANVIFVRLSKTIVQSLRAAGIEFFDWPLFGPDIYRLVAGFQTGAKEIDALVDAMQGGRPEPSVI